MEVQAEVVAVTAPWSSSPTPKRRFAVPETIHLADSPREGREEPRLVVVVEVVLAADPELEARAEGDVLVRLPVPEDRVVEVVESEVGGPVILAPGMWMSASPRRLMKSCRLSVTAKRPCTS